MKVLWLSHFVPYPPKGGALQRSHNLLRHVAGRHEVHLVSLNNAKNLREESAVGEAARFLEGWCKRVDVFPIPSDAAGWRWALMTSASYLRPSTYDVNWLHNNAMRGFLKTVSEKERFDLLHVDTIGLIPYTAPFRGTPVVLNHHNVESHMMARRFENEGNRVHRLYFRREAGKIRRYEREVCPKCAVNLVVSELDGARLRENVGDVDISVVPNGVDVDYFRPAVAAGSTRDGLIFAGGMDWYPNKEAVRFFMREIWPKLREGNRRTTATFLGRNPPAELIDAARDPAVRVPGFVDDVRPYLEKAAIYVCPIRDGGGTRLKILDALAMEMPLVATGLAVEGLDLTDGTHYLKAETGAEFASQIRRLEDDPGLCQNLGAAGRQFVKERFSWEVIGEELEDAYRRAIRPQGNRLGA